MDNSPLNNIPAELRNRIYEYALYENGSVAISPNFITEPGLLRTCKQVRAEAELLFYAVNRFTAICDFCTQSGEGLLSWLQRKQGKRLALMQRLTIRTETPGIDVESLLGEWPSDPLERHPFVRYAYGVPQGLGLLDIGERQPGTLFYFKLNGTSDEKALTVDGVLPNPSLSLEQYICWVAAVNAASHTGVLENLKKHHDVGFNLSWLKSRLETLHEMRKAT